MAKTDFSARLGDKPHNLVHGSLAAIFESVRAQTRALVQPLSPEDCQLQSMADASPAKWHLAHTTWFFETFVLEHLEPSFKPFDLRFRVLFNSYYNGIGDKHPRAERGLISRPSLDEVLTYRAHVDERVLSVLSQTSGVDPELEQLVTLGLHHEQQHQELILTDVKHALSRNPAKPAYIRRWPLARIAPQPQTWHRFAGGLVNLGADASKQGGFVFDIETPRHQVFISPFELASRPVSNGDWLAFMADGGYERAELWLAMGWDWLQGQGRGHGQNESCQARTMPLYWEKTRQPDGSVGYQNFSLHGLVTIDVNTPVCHVSYFEADAFARWSGARLPTEFEWELAATSRPESTLQGNFMESAVFHPMAAQHGDSVHPSQLFGDVWEWTQSNFNPYPGYKPWEGLVGEYNGKFMCNQFVLRGGSCATPLSHIRATYRNFFPPDACWQFSGLRLARDAG